MYGQVRNLSNTDIHEDFNGFQLGTVTNLVAFFGDPGTSVHPEV